MAEQSKMTLKIDGKQAERQTDALNRKFKTLDRSGDKVQRKFRDIGRTSRTTAGGMRNMATSVGGLGSAFARLASPLGIVTGLLGTMVGIKITRYIAGAIRTFADFDHTMKGAEAVLQGTTAQMDALSKKAQELGRTTKFTAQESASAIEVLAKNGLGYTDIMGGALDATLALSAATGSDLPTAADIATDAMLQFNKEAGDLMDVADQITGVTVNSKFAIEDYAFAMAQAGGVAAELGVEFEDMNLVIAATSSLFKRGGDAGTSFKTFLTRLVKPTDEAKKVMEQYNLEFFDAQGNMKSTIEIANNLRDSFKGVSEQAKGAALGEIFGTDAIRTALGLMKLSNEQLLTLQERIGGVDAKAQALTRTESLSGVFTRLGSAVNGLAIAIGQRLAPYVSAIITPLTEFINLMTSKIELPSVSLQLEDEIREVDQQIIALDRRLNDLREAADIRGGWENMPLHALEQYNDVLSQHNRLVDRKNILQQDWVALQKELNGVTDDGIDNVMTEQRQIQILTDSLWDLSEVLKDIHPWKGKVAEQTEVLTEKTKGLHDLIKVNPMKMYKDDLEQFYKILEDAVGTTKDISVEQITLNTALDRGIINWNTYADAVFEAEGFIEDVNTKTEEVAQTTEEKVTQMGQIWENFIEGIQSSYVGFFKTTFRSVLGESEFSFKEFKDNIVGLFIDMLAEMAAAWSVSKIAKIFGWEIGGNPFGSWKDIFGGGGNKGSEVAAAASAASRILPVDPTGGGIEGAITGGPIAKAVTSVFKSADEFFTSLKAGVSKFFSGTYTAAGNLGFKGPGAFATQAQGAGAGIGWGGVAVPLAIGAYGFGVQAKKQAQRRERQQEFFSQVGTGTSESLGSSGFDFRGMLNDSEAFFSTARTGWQETIAALERVGVLTQGWGAMLDENGNGLVKIQGDVEGVKEALGRAKIAGFSFATSLDVALEKGNHMRVNLIGDFDTIKAAMEEATEKGIGGFYNLEKTAGGASAKISGDLLAWQSYFRTLVHDHISGAISGVNSLSSATNSLTGQFERAAKAASKIKLSSVSGGRAAQVDGNHADGKSYIPFDGYIARLHEGERILTKEQNNDYMNRNDAKNVVGMLAQIEGRLASIESNSVESRKASERTERRARVK